MRLFEIIVIILLLLLLIGEWCKIRSNVKKAIFVGLLITVLLHITLEGIRWQLTIVYLLSLTFITSYFFKISVRKKWLRKTFIIISIVLVMVSGCVGYVIPVFELPPIDGKYAVGTMTHIIETKEKKPDQTEIKAWYPIDQAGALKDVYCEKPSSKFDGLMGMPGFLFSHLNLVSTGGYKDASTKSIATKFPLVVYAHGAASINLDNTALLQEIASNGYIVISLDFDFSFEKYELSLMEASTLELDAQKRFMAKLMKRVVPIQSDKIIAVVNQLKTENLLFVKNIDFEKRAFIGHSLGGTTCASIDANKLMPTAILNIDGPMPSNSTINCPFLYISSYSPDLPDQDLEEKGLPDPDFYRKVKKYELENVTKFFEGNDSVRHWVRFTNAGHLDFTDIPYMIPLMASKGYEKVKGHQLKCQVMLNFLNCYLKKENDLIKIDDATIKWLK